MRTTTVVMGLLVATVVPLAASGQTHEIFTEDFEAGLGAWTQMVYLPDGPCGVNNNTPIVFDASGAGPGEGTDDDIHGDNTGYPGSQAVGFSSNLDSGCFDGQQPQWIEIQWEGLLSAGTYDVVILVDRYVYLDSDRDGEEDDEGTYGLGDRIYVLTEGKYDNPVMNYDGGMDADGSRWSKWSNKEPGNWEIGAIKRGQDIATTDGDVELRLLMHEKAAGYNTVAWDNLTMTLRDQATGAVVFTYPSGTAGTLTTRTDDDNGVVTSAGHGLVQDDIVDVSWGNSGIRRMTVSSVNGDDVTLAGEVGADDALPALDTAVVVNKPEDFEGENPLAGWTTKLYGPPPNDTPQTFTSTDPALYWNVDNPGDTSAGYSSDMDPMDFTQAAWMQQQFEARVPKGTYNVTYEYDVYVYKYPDPNYDQFTLFPSDGTGIYGPNTGHSATQTVGTSWDPPAHDDTEYIWIQQQSPAAVAPGTYDVYLDADVYVYLENGTGDYQSGSRILFLTDDEYDNPWKVDPNGDVSPGFRASTWNHECPPAGPKTGGTWVHKSVGPLSVTTTTGNIEVRLVSDDKMQVSPGEFTIAWDNVVVSVRPTGGGPETEVWGLSDDFELGYGDWTYGYKWGDPWGVGNRMSVLTDDEYDDPNWNHDGSAGNGFRVDYWPGGPWDADKPMWTDNGVWQHVVQEEQVTTATGNIEVRLLMYDKHSGDQAVAWDNLALTFAVPTPPCNDPWFDADGDNDVDQDDFGAFQACITGAGDPGGVFVYDDCQCSDTDGDADVDDADLTYFEHCASGPDVAADPSCDEVACCLGGGSCADYVPVTCVLQGGDPQGMGTDCATTVCP